MRIVPLAALLVLSAVPGLLAEDPAASTETEVVVKVGKPAPDFALPGLHVDPKSGEATTDDKLPFQLSYHAGKRPVLIIFSSFT